VNPNSIFPYILAFGATPRSPNGIGYCAKNGAGINGIGSLGIFQRICFYALNGGQLTLNNSGTQFGDISMQASGNIEVVEPISVDSALLVANVSAGESIIANSSSIIDDMWEDLVANGPEADGSPNAGGTTWTSGFDYDEAKCQRDIGYIVNAVAYDVILNTNYNSITAGLAYRRGNSGLVISGQFEQTLAALEYIKDYLLEETLQEVTREELDLRFDNIIEVFYGSSPDDRFYTLPTGAVQTQENAKNLFFANSEVIKAQVLEYIETFYPFLQYDREKCARDVGYILEAISHDIIYGGNYASRIAADAYFEGTQSLLGSTDETTATIAVYEFLKSSVFPTILEYSTASELYPGQNTVLPEASSSERILAQNLLQIIIDVLNAGSTSVLPPLDGPSILWTSTDDQTDYATIVNSIPTLQTEVIEYINEKYQGFVYDAVKCRRDLGYIIDAITYDYALRTNYNSITAGLAYLGGNATAVIENQLEQTVQSLEYLNKLIDNQYVYLDENESLYIDGSTRTEIRKLIRLILDIMENQTNTEEIVFKEPINVNPRLGDVKDQLQANRDLIQDSILTFISNNYPTLTYDQAKCRRDVGYVIDAVTHDMLYGGNYATRIAADSYIVGSTIQLGTGELGPTIAAFQELQTIASEVVQGLFQNQDTFYKFAGPTEAQSVSDLIQIVIDVLQDGNTDSLSTVHSLSEPDLSWRPAVVQNDVQKITDQKSFLQDAVIDYIDSQYGNYYEKKTKRDAENFILALSLDLKGATPQLAKSFALGLFTIDAQLSFPAVQLPAYYHTWGYMRDRIVQLLGAGTDEAIMITALVDDIIIETISNPTIITIGAIVESLAHQFNNAGAGVNRNALPLNFRRPGFNRTVPFTVIQTDGGRVRWSGADELNNQYFAGGTKINGITGKFEGRPFNISVRQIARRLANSRGSF